MLCHTQATTLSFMDYQSELFEKNHYFGIMETLQLATIFKTLK